MRPDESRLARGLKRAVADPWDALLHLWRQAPLVPFRLRADFDLFERPHYAYCLHQAAILARALGVPAISAIEFGVAGGRGLNELESLGRLVTSETGVGVEIYGFDLGSGLPEPVDYRDLPYVWQAGYFEMDVDALENRLSVARLVLGDVASTTQTFFERYQPAPIGFVAFDLDYYSSTAASLQLFEAADEQLLPRVWCYFDDTVGTDQVLHCEGVGQLRAIREFNEKHEDRMVAPVNGLRHKRYRPRAWCDAVYAMHSFHHPRYNSLVGEGGPTQLPL